MLELVLHDLLKRTEEHFRYPQPDALGYLEMPSYEEALRDKVALRIIAELLYKKNIPNPQIDPEFNCDHKPISKIMVDEKNAFYLKKVQERRNVVSGAATEALGMTLSNLLIDTKFEFRVYSETIAMKEIIGRRFDEISDDVLNLYPEAYGKACQFAVAVELADRKPQNIILTNEGEFINIDFAFLFHGTSYLLGFRTPKDREKVQESRYQTRQLIGKNISQKYDKIIHLLDLAELRGGPKAKLGLKILTDYLK